MKTVIALFETAPDAREAVDGLLLRKYDRSDISVLASDLAALHEAPHLGQIATGAVGAIAGAAALSIPYLGPVLAAGPLLAALGAVGGEERDGSAWLVRALGRIDVPEAQATMISEAVRRGAAVVIVRAREAVADDIAALLSAFGAVDVSQWLRPEGVRRTG